MPLSNVSTDVRLHDRSPEQLLDVTDGERQELGEDIARSWLRAMQDEFNGTPRFREIEVASWPKVSEWCGRPVVGFWVRSAVEGKISRFREGGEKYLPAGWFGDSAGVQSFADKLWAVRDDEVKTAAAWCEAILHQLLKDDLPDDGWRGEPFMLLSACLHAVAKVLGDESGYHYRANTVYKLFRHQLKPPKHLYQVSEILATRTAFVDNRYQLVCFRGPFEDDPGVQNPPDA